jgi:hypothetical protein
LSPSPLQLSCFLPASERCRYFGFESDVVGQADPSERTRAESLQSIALMNPRDLDWVGAGFLFAGDPSKYCRWTCTM